MRWNLGLTIFVAGLSLVLVVTLARPQPRSAQVDLVVWDWWSPSTTESYKAYFDDLAREFRTQHPEIQLRFQFIPFSNYPQKLTTGFAGRRPPDVFQCSVSWAETLYDRGVIRELNDLVERTPQLAMDQFLPAAVRHNQKNGRIFGIPIILDANCLIYNIDLFEQLGLPTDPHAIDSWETFLEFCRKLTVLDESGRVVRAGFGMNSFRLSAGIFHPWLYADGGKFYNEASGRAVFDSPEGIEAARFLLLLRDQKVVPPFSPQLDIQEQFIAGKIAMYIDGTWSGKYIERNSEGRARFAMTNLPPGPHGHGRTTVTWANMLMMSKACKHPGAAWEFIKFTAGIDGSLLRLKHLGQNSPRKDLYERPEWKEMVAKKPYLGMVEEICISGAKRPWFESSAAESAFGPYFERLLISGTADDVPAVLHAAAAHVTRIYERARAFFVGTTVKGPLSVVSSPLFVVRGPSSVVRCQNAVDATALIAVSPAGAVGNSPGRKSWVACEHEYVCHSLCPYSPFRDDRPAPAEREPVSRPSSPRFVVLVAAHVATLPLLLPPLPLLAPSPQPPAPAVGTLPPCHRVSRRWPFDGGPT